jgi:hypothetical protein
MIFDPPMTGTQDHGPGWLIPMLTRLLHEHNAAAAWPELQLR